MSKKRKKHAPYGGRKVSRKAAPRRKLLWLGLVMVLLTTASIAATVLRFHEESVAVDVTGLKHSLREWPVIPCNRSLVKSVSINIPKVSVVRYNHKGLTPSQIAANLTQSHVNALKSKIFQIIGSCPDKDISTTLYRMIRSGSIHLRIVPKFVERAHSFGKFTVEYVSGRLVPVIRLPLEGIAQVYSRHGIAKLWLVLVHEFRHYRQWIDAGKPEPSKFLRDPVSIWNGELDAKKVECLRATEWGVAHDYPRLLGNACDALECPRAFSQRQFKAYFEEHYKRGITYTQEEIHEYAKLAGHPFPGAYR